KSRSNVQNVHFFILFLNEWTSKCGIFIPHWSLEKPPEFERVWGGLCTLLLRSEVRMRLNNAKQNTSSFVLHCLRLSLTLRHDEY
ncbi:MAG: hypothetical protein IJK08_12100, partial [Prevotella sp.]|nr:hypothetical protein [Prevotella sp.]